MFQQETPSWKENVQKADYDNMAALILTSEFPFAYVYMHNHYIQ
jgi:predicted membrane channel-forming protein YqfA (hemolysin III family)